MSHFTTRTTPAGTSASASSILIYEDYHSAYNAVVQPDKYVACSRYFISRWMPLLGGVGTQIVLALRSLGFYNPRTGERREGISIDLPALASLCGVSVSTLKREFGSKRDGTPTNPHLHRFVQRERQVHQDMTGRILRDPNVYVIKMDDPLHALDQSKLEVELETRAEKSRIAQIAPIDKSRIAQNEPREVQTERSIAQIDPRTAQIEPLYKVSITSTTQERPQTPAAPPRYSPAAIPEKSPEKSLGKNRETTEHQSQIDRQGTAKIKAALEAAKKGPVK